MTFMDLKKENETWDVAFLSHPFGPRQKKLLKNMNIRYECIDARDSFYTQLKNGTIAFPGIEVSRYDVDEMRQRDELEDLECMELSDYGINTEELVDLGKREAKRQVDLAKMTSAMTDLGWNTPVMGQSFPVTGEHPPLVSVLPAAHWKTVVSNQRADIIKERQQTIDPKQPLGFNRDAADLPGVVDIVDWGFLQEKH
ncbi:hypothetical protein DXG01_003151 [Tephrocybe rancida]|nr:hypothetical protein DXG01_003151 [Tephrocybe rancida]